MKALDVTRTVFQKIRLLCLIIASAERIPAAPTIVTEREADRFGPDPANVTEALEFESSLLQKVKLLYLAETDWEIYLHAEAPDPVVVVGKYGDTLVVVGKRANPGDKTLRGKLTLVAARNMLEEMHQAHDFARTEGNQFYASWETVPSPEVLCEAAWEAWDKLRGIQELPSMSSMLF